MCHVCEDDAHLGGGVGHNLGPAVRESHLVTTSGVVAITLLVGVEVGEAVVILDGVGVLVHGDLVSVGDRGGVVGWSRGAVGGDGGGGGGEGAGGQSRGEESLKLGFKFTRIITAFSLFHSHFVSIALH